MQSLPEIPVGVLALFPILLAFVVDFVTDIYKARYPGSDLPTWAKNCAGLLVGQLLCWWLAMDVFASAGWTTQATGIGIALTGVLMTATAAKIVHPAAKALMGVGKVCSPPG